ncbi:uncharacterized protein LOC124413333 isoform X2 [Diprion similis]|uniref:uncharacterized protein LOC124413333 isoform X2 n=1 Tax=Diprion similis TaxID=362088 RepID=UPI001EF91E10|nr:uncharacterized protein LOC124413333 isoform X2 [Diprion similis]
MRGYSGHPRLTVKWLRLGSLLVTLLVASIHGAPTMTTDRRILQGKWVNPCGLALTDGDPDGDVPQLNDSQLLSQVVIQAKTALMHAEIFRDDYINKTFRSNFAKVHNDWKANHYDWLPNKQDIPKELNESLAKEYLDKLELDKALLDAYEFMQTYAVGLEQIVWDQKDNNSEFQKLFADTEYKLRTVLCELQAALVERGVKPRPDVTRDVMVPEIRRSMNEAMTSLRDWIIFRDYMNGLEYIIEVFEHLGDRLRS